MRRAGTLLSGAASCAAHASMCNPPSWLDPDGTFGCSEGREWAGCTAQLSNGTKCTPYSPGCGGGRAPGQSEQYEGCVFEWYTNYTFNPSGPTILKGSPLLTQRLDTWEGDWSKRNPWRAPGSAPVFSPCGHDGGNPRGCPAGKPDPAAQPQCGPTRGSDTPPTPGLPDCPCEDGGYGHGPDARSLKGNTRPVEWTVGAVAEVAWTVNANHGGGYSYRLCPKPASNMDLTEDCFQRTPLSLLGDTQWAQFPNGTRVAFPAVRTTEGTTPAGSQWTRNPIPGCYDPRIPSADGAGGSCDQTQFPMPFPGAKGFLSVSYVPGRHVPDGVVRMPNHFIVDKLRVPPVEPGDYVISFRYDSEQTSQVWNTCGDVRISA